MVHCGAVDCSATLELQDSSFEPELRLLSMWNFMFLFIKFFSPPGLHADRWTDECDLP